MRLKISFFEFDVEDDTAVMLAFLAVVLLIFFGSLAVVVMA